MSGSEVRISWNGRAVTAWVPDKLAKAGPVAVGSNGARYRACGGGRTQGQRRFANRLGGAFSLAIESRGGCVLLRRGHSCPAGADVAAAESIQRRPGRLAAWVADNLAAVIAAIAEGRDEPLRVASLH